MSLPPTTGKRRPRRTFLVALVTLATSLSAVALIGSGSPASAETTTPLVGTFKLTPGQQVGTQTPTGSYFRMVQPGGNLTSGPFVANGNSTATTKTYTLFSPGTDGGLLTGGYQPQPAPAFDGNGNAKANRIIQPTPFFGVNFSVSTNNPALQSGGATTLPQISVDENGNLSGDLRSFSASWNTQHFDQGSPKPDGTRPGLTQDAHGTYNAATGAYVLEWSSLIVGGPFNSFTGTWHFEGTFVPTNAVPTVSGLSPTSGPEAGGNTVTINGTSLANVSAVKFGSAAATIVTRTSTSITAKAPAGTGTVNVTVTNPGGTSVVSGASAYTYTAAPVPAPTVTKVNPSSGPEAGGNTVTITGTGLATATSVKFGTTAATILTRSATSITVTAPAGAGIVDVTVTSPSGTSAIVTADRYTYKAPSSTDPITGLVTALAATVTSVLTALGAISVG